MQPDRVEELNQRIFSRMKASGEPAVLFSPRPVPTKYVHPFPVVVDPAPPTVKLRNLSKEVAFLPTDCKAPGATDWVDLESTLKNMDFALQKNDRAVYVPSSKSDLYLKPTTKTTPVRQTHPLLFAHVVTPNSGIPANVQQSNKLFHNVRLRTPA
jgi:hypothetical protein